MMPRLWTWEEERTELSVVRETGNIEPDVISVAVKIELFKYHNLIRTLLSVTVVCGTKIQTCLKIHM